MTYKFSTPTEYETEIARLVRRFHFETKGKNKIKKDAYLIINEYNRFLEDPDGLDLEEFSLTSRANRILALDFIKGNYLDQENPPPRSWLEKKI